MTGVSTQVGALPRREAHPLARPRSLSVGAWLPLVGILVGIVSLFYLAQTSELTTTGYSIQELQAQENELRLRNEQLALELSKAKSLAVVEAEATRRLLMVPPKEIVYLQAPNADGRRASASSRGETRSVPQLEKAPAVSEGGLLDPVRNTLSAILAPRVEQTRR